MKKFYLFLLLSLFSTQVWSQWPITCLIGPTTVDFKTIKNSRSVIYRIPDNSQNCVWSVTGNYIITNSKSGSINSISVEWIGDGVGTVSVTYNDPITYLPVASKFDITILNSLYGYPTQATIIGPTTVEYNLYKPVIYKTNKPGYEHYSWSVDGGYCEYDGNDGDSIFVYWNSDSYIGSNYANITVSYQNLLGDKSNPVTIPITITKSTIPSNIIVEKPTIIGETSTLTGKTYTYKTSGDYYRTEWEIVGGTILGYNDRNLNNYCLNSINVVWDNVGQNSLKVKGCNSMGTYSTEKGEYMVNSVKPPNPIPDPEIVGELNPVVGTYYTYQAPDYYFQEWEIVGGTIVDYIYGAFGFSSQAVVSWDNTPGEKSLKVWACKGYYIDYPDNKGEINPVIKSTSTSTSLNNDGRDDIKATDIFYINNTDIVISSVPDNSICHIYDIHGKLISNNIVSDGSYISLGELSKGIYIASIDNINIKFIRK